MPTATLGYRQDLRTSGAPFGAHDGAWILVAALIEDAARVAPSEAPRLLDKAAGIATSTLGKAETNRLARREYGAEWNRLDVLLLLALAMQDAGALHLSAAILDALRRSSVLTEVQQGRAIALRARIAYRLEQTDLAEDLFRQVERLGRRISNDELRVRGWIGLSVLAQVRGNNPEFLAWSRRAARVVDKLGLSRLGKAAHVGVVIGAAKLKRFDEALVHAWAMYRWSLGDPIDESESLQTIGQLLLEVGESNAARTAFAKVLSRKLPVRILLPALGGFAIASARLGPDRASDLDWAIGEVRRARDTIAPRYSYASALLECAGALVIVGRFAEAEVLRREVVRVAAHHRFHELEFEAEKLDTSSRVPARRVVGRLKASASEIVRSVHSLRPGRLPRHVLVMTAADA